MKVYTCTPFSFHGDESFFSRDSGLFCRVLQSIGVESKVVMPAPAMDGDIQKDLIRCTEIEIRDPVWWKSLNLDGLILYSWASPKYNLVVRAVRDAEIPVMVMMDTSGMISKLSPLGEFWREAHKRFLYENKGLSGFLKEAYRLTTDAIYNRSARLRLPHYDAASVIATVTPLAALWIPGEVVGLKRIDLANKFVYLPHPQSHIFKYDGSKKENIVLTVGRWEKNDWPPKNPITLIKAYEQFLKNRPEWRGIIVGKGATRLLENLKLKKTIDARRLSFMEHVPIDELPSLYSKAKIGFWASRWEGQQATGAQALCCGCSVVSHNSAHLSCFRHYVSRASGRLARHNEESALARELILESDSWLNGHRDPYEIAKAWFDEFNAPDVAKRALSYLGLNLV